MTSARLPGASGGTAIDAGPAPTTGDSITQISGAVVTPSAGIADAAGASSAGALSAIREHAPECKRVVLVLDTMLTTQDGRKSDAIVAMGSELGQETGPMWAQIYRPRRWFRRFRVEGKLEKIGEVKNLIREALAAREPAIANSSAVLCWPTQRWEIL